MTTRRFAALGAIAVAGLGVVVLMSLPARPVQAQTVAAGPYYATPSWDQTLACATPAACPRFVVLSNMGGEAVLDRETGLVWQREPLTAATDWDGAVIRCWIEPTGNRKGWRLPTFEEMGSLLPLPAGHPFELNIAPGSFVTFWTATSDPDEPTWAWRWQLSNPDGGAGKHVKVNDESRPWCVRGPQSLPF